MEEKQMLEKDFKEIFKNIKAERKQNFQLNIH